jgi:ferredoxin-thioredoxin reductase catalytic subunit
MMEVAIIVNPNAAYTAEVKRKLKEYGGYCPCSIIRNEDTKCMCKEFREQKSGMCHCGLYIKEKKI